MGPTTPWEKKSAKVIDEGFEEWKSHTLVGRCHCSYFTLRSGGKTVITFLFDSGYTWVVSVPLAMLAVKVLHLDVRVAYAIVEFANVVKDTVGYLFVKSGRWIQNLTTLDSNADT